MNGWHQNTGRAARGSRAVLLRFGLLLVMSGCWLQPAAAVPVSEVFAADVDMPDRGGLPQAFDAALERVLVKVTGSPELGTSAARTALVRDAGALVSRYSTLPDNRVRVEFNAAALQAALDAAGQPVWGLDRPLVALWYAADAGNGQRQLIGAASEGPAAAAEDAVRQRLLEAAEARGLPVVLPLLDSEDRGRVSFADVWGEFESTLRAASQRYGGEALLVGRARTLDPDARRVRWRLFTGGSEVVAWEGSVADGPAQAADYFAQRLATFAGAADQVRLRVGNIDTLVKYGQLRRYLLGLNVVASASVARVQNDQIEFDLTVRGDAQRLRQALDAAGPLSPADRDAVPAAPTLGVRPPDLRYVWAEPR